MNIDSETPTPGGQFLVYQTEDGKLKIDVRFEGETVWLTQQHMAELFQTTQQNVSLHLQNIYAEGGLQPEATHKESLSVRQEGGRTVRRRVDFYNLDAILSVGYRVKSAVATRFRIWATRLLREYIVKGFVLDDERLKNPDQPFDYFDELMRRIQDIRTAERRFYQKITDISDLERPRHPHPCRPYFARNGPGQGRAGIRQIQGTHRQCPPPRGSGLRAGHERFEETAKAEKAQTAEEMSLNESIVKKAGLA
jgi:hypothetical protein